MGSHQPQGSALRLSGALIYFGAQSIGMACPTCAARDAYDLGLGWVKCVFCGGVYALATEGERQDTNLFYAH